MDQVSGTAVEKGNAVIQLTASPNKGGRGSQFKRIVGREKLDMNHLIHMINAPALSDSCAARIGRQLVVIGFGLKAAHGLVAVILSILLGEIGREARRGRGEISGGGR